MSLSERQSAATVARDSRYYDPGQTVVNLSSLDKFRRVGLDRYVACCPAHNDKNPSLSITQTQDKVLVHCFAGCEQRDVLLALTELGLWNRQSQGGHSAPKERYSAEEIDFMANYCFVANSMKRKGKEPNAEERKALRGYFRVLRRHQPDLAISIAEDARNV